MTIRTILAGVSGGSASGGTLDIACRLAEEFNAHLEALHVRVDIAELAIAGGAEGLAAPSLSIGWVNELETGLSNTAERVKQAFVDSASRHGLPRTANPRPGRASAFWREETGDASAVISRRARFFDLTVLGRSDRIIGKAHTDVIEQTLIGSGRPVLIAPADSPAVIGNTIAVGWNGSDQAVRALVAAIPFLRKAHHAVIITVGKAYEKTAESLRDYLRLHDVAAKISNVLEVPASAPGSQLLSAARDEGADLLVMGGYGHMPWREALFGGVTHDLVGVSLLPLLIAH